MTVANYSVACHVVLGLINTVRTVFLVSENFVSWSNAFFKMTHLFFIKGFSDIFVP
jgi:hypothetical protein